MRARAEGSGYFGRAVGEQLQLDPGEVVLGLAGDLLEQLGAAAGVEILRRQALGRMRQAGEHVAEDVVGGGRQVGKLGNRIHTESWAHSRPGNGKRAAGGTKWGRQRTDE